ncbi:MAG: hypothetical protein ABI893_14425 [Polaromonas sp.]
MKVEPNRIDMIQAAALNTGAKARWIQNRRGINTFFANASKVGIKALAPSTA